MAKLLSEQDLEKMDRQLVFCVPVVAHEVTFDSIYSGLGWHTVIVEKGRLVCGNEYWDFRKPSQDLIDGFYYLAFDKEVSLQEAILANNEFSKRRELNKVGMA